MNLDNFYMSDIVKNDELNTKTGNVKLISKLKVISALPSQLIEVSNLAITEKRLSIYDLLNYVLVKENNIISRSKTLNACSLLKQCPTTRIPEVNINSLRVKFKRDLITI